MPPRSTPRAVGQHHGDLRRALLEAALTMLDRGEHASLTLREIARRAGVSSAAPYHHFADKDALLAAVAEEGFRALDDALDDAAAGTRTPRTALARMTARYVTFALEHRAHYRVMVSPLLGVAAEGPLRTAAMTSFRRLAEAVARAAPATADPESLAMFAWALAHGVVMLAMDGALTALGATSVDALARRTGDQVARLVDASG